MNRFSPFLPGEVSSLLHDPDVAAAGLAGLHALKVLSAAPLAARLPEEEPVRKAAFALSLQGLSPRLASLAGVETLPPLLRAHLESEAERCEARGERILSTLRQLSCLFRRLGISAIPLKGAALILRGDIPARLRPMADIDILLGSEDAVRVAASGIQTEMGYRPAWNTYRHLVLCQDCLLYTSEAETVFS